MVRAPASERVHARTGQRSRRSLRSIFLADGAGACFGKGARPYRTAFQEKPRCTWEKTTSKGIVGKGTGVHARTRQLIPCRRYPKGNPHPLAAFSSVSPLSPDAVRPKRSKPVHEPPPASSASSS